MNTEELKYLRTALTKGHVKFRIEGTHRVEGVSKTTWIEVHGRRERGAWTIRTRMGDGSRWSKKFDGPAEMLELWFVEFLDGLKAALEGPPPDPGMLN